MWKPLILAERKFIRLSEEKDYRPKTKRREINSNRIKFIETNTNDFYFLIRNVFSISGFLSDGSCFTDFS